VKIETIAIGDELLSGKIADTNSKYVAEAFFRKGLRLNAVSVIPDTIEALHDTMRSVGQRADVVICFGGLGPTSDDKTAEAAASLLGTDLVTHEPSKENMLAMYRSRAKTPLPSAMKQVLYPRGSEALANAKGAAPGFHFQFENARFYFLPGVPMEMKVMFDVEVMNDLKSRWPEQIADGELLSHQWKCLHIWESELQSKMNPVEAALPKHAWLGYRTHFPENHLTLYWRGRDKAAFDKECEKIRTILAPYTYSEGREELENLILAKLKSTHSNVALAESCTGGLAIHRLTQIPGASDQVWGGVTAYRVEAKLTLLHLNVASLEAAVSAQCAREMAESVRAISGCAFGASITGYVGPGGGTEKDPVGTVYVCVVGEDVVLEKRFVLAVRERAQTQWGAATYLLATLLEALGKK